MEIERVSAENGANVPPIRAPRSKGTQQRIQQFRYLWEQGEYQSAFAQIRHHHAQLIYNLLEAGYSQSEAGRRLGVDRRYIHQELQYLKEELRPPFHRNL